MKLKNLDYYKICILRYTLHKNLGHMNGVSNIFRLILIFVSLIYIKKFKNRFRNKKII